MSVRFTIEKASIIGDYVRGWAYVAEEGGRQLTDLQGDVIELSELRKAAHDYMSRTRIVKAQHSGSAVGEMVESIIIDDAVAKSLGMTTSKRGWWVGMKIKDASVRKSIRDGKLRSFSIGGTGTRTALKVAA